MFGLTGEDTIMIDNRVLGDFADADYGKVEFPNELVTVKASKNGNVLVGENASGALMELTLRLQLGSPDDKYLNSRMVAQKSDIATFIALTGMINKRVGDSMGGVSNVIYQASAGVFKKMPGSTSNAEGASDQAVVIYTITFGQAPRSIQ